MAVAAAGVLVTTRGGDSQVENYFSAVDPIVDPVEGMLTDWGALMRESPEASLEAHAGNDGDQLARDLRARLEGNRGVLTSAVDEMTELDPPTPACLDAHDHLVRKFYSYIYALDAFDASLGQYLSTGVFDQPNWTRATGYLRDGDITGQQGMAALDRCAAGASG